MWLCNLPRPSPSSQNLRMCVHPSLMLTFVSALLSCVCAAPFQKEVMKFRNNEAKILRKQAVWQVRTPGAAAWHLVEG